MLEPVGRPLAVRPFATAAKVINRLSAEWMREVAEGKARSLPWRAEVEPLTESWQILVELESRDNPELGLWFKLTDRRYAANFDELGVS